MANDVTVQKKQSMATWLGTDAVKQQVQSVVGERESQSFISSVVSAVQTNPQLAECTNSSILSAALVGHSLKLPHSPQLGYYWMVPYDNTKKDSKGKEIKVKEAQFQLGWRGYVQLAMRTGEYQKIHVTEIKEGELKSYNPITDEFELTPEMDANKRSTLSTVGYYAFFILNNGSKKELYWSKEKMDAHAKKYSFAYRKGWESSNWKKDFDSMAFKTMIRQLLSKWGIMSTEMQTAYNSDYATIDENGQAHYLDNVPDEPYKAQDVYAKEEVIDSTATEVTEEEDAPEK